MTSGSKPLGTVSMKACPLILTQRWEFFKSEIFDLNGRDFRILIPQDWKVVLGEFDDTKEDGWEETYDVSFILTAMMSD